MTEANSVKPKTKKAKRPKESAQEILFKTVDLSKVPAPTGPLVTSAKVFRPFYDICAFYLEKNSHSETARNLVATLAYHFRSEAQARFKHDTVECYELTKLLQKNVGADNIRRGRIDAISHINSNPNMMMRLDVDQMENAESIQRIWQAFGKGLMESVRDISRQGGSGQILHPLDTMDQGLWEHYQRYYKPWYRFASRITIARKGQGQPVSVAGIIFTILVKDLYPEELDQMYELKRGVCLKVFRRALTHYQRPEELEGALRPPKPASSVAETAAGSVSAPPPSPAAPQPESAPQRPAKKAAKKTKRKPRPLSGAGEVAGGSKKSVRKIPSGKGSKKKSNKK
jgi:hypothetical protein